MEDEETEPLDELILPQLHAKPALTVLLSILSAIAIFPSVAAGKIIQSKYHSRYARFRNRPEAVKWLTGIIANPLEWIEEEEDRDKVWEEAGRRIAERCGRTAMPDLTRTFKIPLANRDKSNSNSGFNSTAESIYSNNDSALEITLHEPGLTADNLGLKTWASSYLMSRRLFPTLSKLLPSSYISNCPSINILELGSGTGLVGITAAATFTNANSVTLTDLPDIVPNLAKNVHLNERYIPALATSTRVEILDWADPYNFPYAVTRGDTPQEPVKKFDLILVADPLYSPAHPGLVSNAIYIYFNRANPHSRAMIQLPLREGYVGEREEFWQFMQDKGFTLEECGVDTGFDDWGGEGPGVGGERDLDDELEEKLEEGVIEDAEERNKGKVRCWWGVYRWDGMER